MAAEKKFEIQIKEFFYSVGVYGAGTPQDKMKIDPKGWFMKVWGGGYQKSGIPDLIACVNGKFVAIEVKAENGKPSVLQEKNIDHINKSKGLGIILYPKDFEWFKNIIKGLLDGKDIDDLIFGIPY